MKKILLTSGLVQPLCDAVTGRGATWSPNGTILFAPNGGARGIFRVADRGGAPEPVTTMAPSAGSEDAHRYPQFLPDGEHFLYLYLTGSPEIAGVYVGSLDGEPQVRVLDGSDRALYTPPIAGSENGYLLFRRGETLLAQPLDLGRLESVGAMFLVADGVGIAGNTGYGALSAANNGTLAYSAGEGRNVELVWLDRSGERVAVARPAAIVRGFSLSPDERKLAFGIREQSETLTADVWLQNLPGGTSSRFTFGPSPGWSAPIWSPDGSEIAFASLDVAGRAQYEIRRKRADMSGGEQVVARMEGRVIDLWDWSPDGKLLLISEMSLGGADLSLVSLEGDGTLVPFVAEEGPQRYGQFSPDGRWIAYASYDQVYVQPNPPTGALRQVSTEGGSMPRWRVDGKELFYRVDDGTLMAVTVSARNDSSGADDAFEHGTPQPLFDSVPSPRNFEFTYQPTSDGQKFLVATPLAGAKTPITVVLNWQASGGN